MPIEKDWDWTAPDNYEERKKMELTRQSARGLEDNHLLNKLCYHAKMRKALMDIKTAPNTLYGGILYKTIENRIKIEDRNIKILEREVESRGLLEED